MDSAAFARLLADLRPSLHRYCARMTGSVIDGEDVLQTALARVLEASRTAPPLHNPGGWVFRVTHNATLDFLRQQARDQRVLPLEEALPMTDDGTSADARIAVASSLRTFLRLPVAQRSSVLLMDVLGHSLEEIAGITGTTLPAVKAALHRGRVRLRALAAEPEESRWPELTPSETRSLSGALHGRCRWIHEGT